MKKKLFTLGIILLFSILTTACSSSKHDSSGQHSSAEGSGKEYQWEIIKSPVTGNCYEIATRAVVAGMLGLGYMGMSPVDCPDDNFEDDNKD